MKIFLDTADVDEIAIVERWGILDGVTTNPTLFSKVGGTYDDVLRRICDITSGPVSAEVVATDADGMVKEGRHFATIAPNIVVKIPMSEPGLEAMSRLPCRRHQDELHAHLQREPGAARGEGRRLAAVPFVGRLDDINEDGMTVVRELVAIVETHGLDTEVLAASIRHPRHMTEAALAGAHVATVPIGVLRKMIEHPLTTSGIESFRRDWDAVQSAASAASATPPAAKATAPKRPAAKRSAAKQPAKRTSKKPSRPARRR